MTLAQPKLDPIENRTCLTWNCGVLAQVLNQLDELILAKGWSKLFKPNQIKTNKSQQLNRLGPPLIILIFIFLIILYRLNLLLTKVRPKTPLDLLSTSVFKTFILLILGQVVYQKQGLVGFSKCMCRGCMGWAQLTLGRAWIN